MHACMLEQCAHHKSSARRHDSHGHLFCRPPIPCDLLARFGACCLRPLLLSASKKNHWTRLPAAAGVVPALFEQGLISLAAVAPVLSSTPSLPSAQPFLVSGAGSVSQYWTGVRFYSDLDGFSIGPLSQSGLKRELIDPGCRHRRQRTQKTQPSDQRAPIDGSQPLPFISLTYSTRYPPHHNSCFFGWASTTGHLPLPVPVYRPWWPPYFETDNNSKTPISRPRPIRRKVACLPILQPTHPTITSRLVRQTVSPWAPNRRDSLWQPAARQPNARWWRRDIRPHLSYSRTSQGTTPFAGTRSASWRHIKHECDRITVTSPVPDLAPTRPYVVAVTTGEQPPHETDPRQRPPCSAAWSFAA